MNKLIETLKQNGEDHEFYPTTDEIIKAMLRDVRKADFRHNMTSVLDIGAGNGKVLRALKDGRFSSFYAIEKSLTLCGLLSDFAYIIGTDFEAQSLLSKQIDLTFCNPPYSTFEAWAVKILRESASKRVYLVLPRRWKDSVEIAEALKYREAEAHTVGSYDFEDSEDRQARAKVDLLRIDLAEDSDDAFDRFFDAQFADLKKRYEEAEKTQPTDSGEKSPKFAALVTGPNLLEMLVDLYDKEIQHIRKNYELAGQLDADMLRELNVTPKHILGALKLRLTGLRNEYWKELFNHMEAVTNRLCTKQRNALLHTLNSNGHVDFTASNAYAVLLWVLKNANAYIDTQLCEVFDSLVGKANVKNYKSNQRAFVYDRWRYNEEKPTHISLEYRLVLEHAGGINRTDYSFERGLAERACELLRDLMTVARNLGFDCATADNRLLGGRSGWRSGTVHSFHCEINGQREELLEARAFLNGNMHVRINQKFALALNVEYGRLKGWLKTPQEAAEELNDPEAAAVFGTAFRLGAKTFPLLSASEEEEQAVVAVAAEKQLDLGLEVLSA